MRLSIFRRKKKNLFITGPRQSFIFKHFLIMKKHILHLLHCDESDNNNNSALYVKRASIAPLLIFSTAQHLVKVPCLRCCYMFSLYNVYLSSNVLSYSLKYLLPISCLEIQDKQRRLSTFFNSRISRKYTNELFLNRQWFRIHIRWLHQGCLPQHDRHAG